MQQVAKKAIKEAAAVMNNEGLDGDDLLLDLVSKFSQWDPFVGLHNQRGQNHFFKNVLNMIEPRRVHLPRKSSHFGRHRTAQPQMYRKDNFTYVPLFELLEQIMSFEDVYEEITTPKNVKPSAWNCFESGLNYKQNPLFKKHPQALQIHLYADEVQMVNELGSRTKNNKIVFVYFSLGNLSPKNRSSLRNIYLLSIFYNRQLVEYGPNVMLKPIVDDLKLLEDGVELMIKGQPLKIFGTLTAFVADNAASHLFGGFLLGFSSGFRKCRSCMATDIDIQTKTFDCEFIPRTYEQHVIQCSCAEDKELSKHFRQLYGIKQFSILDELKYFNTISGLPPDIMHDLLEGILPKTIRLLILDCLKKNYFTINELNHIISNFDYGFKEVVDKPSPFDQKSLKNGSFRQSAAQTWLLAVNLPLMIGSKVPENLHWLCFTTLLNICRIIFLNVVTSLDLLKLEQLIHEFLIYFKNCFDTKLTIKFHHLTHYPRHIRNFGPLNAVWTMRYEAKHSFFKQLQRQIKNTKNIPHTLSIRHQQWLCHEFRKSGSRLLEVKLSGLGKKSLSFLSRLEYGKDVADFFNVKATEAINAVKWVTVGSTTFHIGSIILCQVSSTGKQSFGKIVNIFVSPSPLFVCKLYEIMEFNEHYQAFCVTELSNAYQCVSPLALEEFRIFGIHRPSFVNETRQFFYIPTKVELESTAVNLA